MLLVDDHAIVREGLRSFLEAGGEAVIVAEAGDGKTAIDLFRLHRPDITIMDVRLPGMSGIAATETIIREFPDAKIIVLTTFENDGYVHAALDAGAWAYLIKDTMRHDLMDAVKKVHAGKRVLAPSVASTLAGSLPRIRLTVRETEVLTLMAKGLRNREIGEVLGTTEGTIKVQVRQILIKLDVTDRTEAVTLALQKGLIEL
jgi:two-component system NarL family response regulator